MTCGSNVVQFVYALLGAAFIVGGALYAAWIIGRHD
jgi:hypothetical protein